MLKYHMEGFILVAVNVQEAERNENEYLVE